MGESFLTSSSFLCLTPILDIPWLAVAALQSLPQLSTGILPSCVHLYISSYKDTSHTWLRPTLLQYDLVLNNYICNNCIPKWGHILRVSTSTYFFGGNNSTQWITNGNFPKQVYSLSVILNKILADSKIYKENFVTFGKMILKCI